MIEDQTSTPQLAQKLKGILKQSSLLSEVQHNTQEGTRHRNRVTFSSDTFSSESLQ